MTEQIQICIVHTADDEHVLTAFDLEGNGICTLTDPDRETVGDITDPIYGERTAILRTVEIDLKVSVNALHRAMYEAAEEEWPAEDEA